MVSMTIVFTTRHRNEDAVEKDCNLIAECINAFSIKYKFLYNGKGVIIFHVYDVTKDARNKILFLILGNIQNDTEYRSLDLQSYTNN